MEQVGISHHEPGFGHLPCSAKMHGVVPTRTHNPVSSADEPLSLPVSIGGIRQLSSRIVLSQPADRAVRPSGERPPSPPGRCGLQNSQDLARGHVPEPHTIVEPRMPVPPGPQPLPLRMRRPSGENFTIVSLVWHPENDLIWRPVSTSHSRRLLSWDRKRPVGRREKTRPPLPTRCGPQNGALPSPSRYPTAAAGRRRRPTTPGDHRGRRSHARPRSRGP